MQLSQPAISKIQFPTITLSNDGKKNIDPIVSKVSAKQNVQFIILSKFGELRNDIIAQGKLYQFMSKYIKY